MFDNDNTRKAKVSDAVCYKARQDEIPCYEVKMIYLLNKTIIFIHFTCATVKGEEIKQTLLDKLAGSLKKH